MSFTLGLRAESAYGRGIRSIGYQPSTPLLEVPKTSVGAICFTPVAMAVVGWSLWFFLLFSFFLRNLGFPEKPVWLHCPSSLQYAAPACHMVVRIVQCLYEEESRIKKEPAKQPFSTNDLPPRKEVHTNYAWMISSSSRLGTGEGVGHSPQLPAKKAA